MKQEQFTSLNFQTFDVFEIFFRQQVLRLDMQRLKVFDIMRNLMVANFQGNGVRS